MQFLIGELFGLLVFAVPDFHAFDAGCDFLAVCADILHDRRADSAWNAGKSFHALQAEVDAVVDEIIPIATRFGVDMHDFFAVFDGSRLIKHAATSILDPPPITHSGKPLASASSTASITPTREVGSIKDAIGPPTAMVVRSAKLVMMLSLACGEGSWKGVKKRLKENKKPDHIGRVS